MCIKRQAFIDEPRLVLPACLSGSCDYDIIYSSELYWIGDPYPYPTNHLASRQFVFHVTVDTIEPAELFESAFPGPQPHRTREIDNAVLDLVADLFKKPRRPQTSGRIDWDRQKHRAKSFFTYSDEPHRHKGKTPNEIAMYFEVTISNKEHRHLKIIYEEKFNMHTIEEVFLHDRVKALNPFIDSLDNAQLDPATLTVTIKSRPDLAMYDMRHNYFWHGEITIPFLDLINNHTTPNRNPKTPDPSPRAAETSRSDFSTRCRS